MKQPKRVHGSLPLTDQVRQQALEETGLRYYVLAEGLGNRRSRRRAARRR